MEKRNTGRTGQRQESEKKRRGKESIGEERRGNGVATLGVSRSTVLLLPGGILVRKSLWHSRGKGKKKERKEGREGEWRRE